MSVSRTEKVIEEIFAAAVSIEYIEIYKYIIYNDKKDDYYSLVSYSLPGASCCSICVSFIGTLIRKWARIPASVSRLWKEIGHKHNHKNWAHKYQAQVIEYIDIC